jgi:hypothetical protein
MLNFDTEIRELHHKTEAKYPSKNTQRRKSEFEYQTATRQIENFAIYKASAHYEITNEDKKWNINNNKIDIENKWYRYEYSPESGLVQKLSKTEYQKCQWVDQTFQDQLIAICEMIFKNNCIDGKLKIFAVHSRYSYLFRADPNYQPGVCWYDWAEVNWANEILPTKLLLFWDIEKNTLKTKFKIGNTTISQPGQYVLCYSMPSLRAIELAHTTSVLVQYGKLDISKH